MYRISFTFEQQHENINKKKLHVIKSAIKNDYPTIYLALLSAHILFHQPTHTHIYNIPTSS